MGYRQQGLSYEEVMIRGSEGLGAQETKGIGANGGADRSACVHVTWGHGR